MYLFYLIKWSHNKIELYEHLDFFRFDSHAEREGEDLGVGRGRGGKEEAVVGVGVRVRVRAGAGGGRGKVVRRQDVTNQGKN